MNGTTGLRFTLTAMLLCILGLKTSADETAKVADVVVVVGAPGKSEYETLFREWASRWQALEQESEIELTMIGLDADQSRSTDRERFLTAVSKQANASEIPLWMILIGHGTYAEDVAKFNLRGPDLSATELAGAISEFKRPIVLVNGSSSSGPFVDRLSGNSRVIVTATKSGTEENFARFAGKFAGSIRSPESDIDHDDEVSVLEAFLRASKEVEQEYLASDRLATEHAVIDDNADQRGTPAKLFRGHRVDGESEDGGQIDGELARQITILRLPAAGKPLSPEQMARRAELEQQHEKLRKQRNTMIDEAYDEALLPIMLELAKLYQPE